VGDLGGHIHLLMLEVAMQDYEESETLVYIIAILKSKRGERE